MSGSRGTRGGPSSAGGRPSSIRGRASSAGGGPGASPGAWLARLRDVARRVRRVIAAELRATGDDQVLTPAQMEALAARQEHRAVVIRRALPVLDALLVGAVVIPPFVALAVGWISGSVPWIVVFTLIAGAAVAIRRRFPLLSLLAATTAFVLAIAVEQPVGTSMFAVLICVLAVARKHTETVTIACSIAVATTCFLAVVGSGQQHPGEPGALINVVLVALAAALGNGLRSNRLYQRSMEQRALQAEASREEEARHRVVQERVRIARELHDLVGHHVAVISIQANVAAQALERDPATAREALAQVRAAARDTLTETAAVVRVLRDDGNDAATAPTPGLAQLEDLLRTVRTGGFAVRVHITGRPVALDPVADVTAYRVIQECLTNAIRHAAEPQATIDLHYYPGEVSLEVNNPAVPDAVPHRALSAHPGDTQPGGAGSQRAEIRATARQRAAQRRAGQERTGPDHTGPRDAGQERTGQDWAGTREAVQERTGPDRTGLGEAGQERTGQDWTGLGEAGQERADWTGTGKAEHERAGQDWTGTREAGHEQAAKERTGPDRTRLGGAGHERAGQERTGSDRTELGEAGHQQAGQERTGSDRSGPGRGGQERAKRERAEPGRGGWESAGRGTASGTGYGLAGMRERVATAGGTFEAGVAGKPGGGGEFYVRVRLPVQRQWDTGGDGA